MSLVPINGVDHARYYLPVVVDSVTLRDAETAGRLRGYQRMSEITGLPPAVFFWNGSRPNSRANLVLVSPLDCEECVDPNPRPSSGIVYP